MKSQEKDNMADPAYGYFHSRYWENLRSEIHALLGENG